MLKDVVSVSEVCDLLNEILSKDPECIQNLISHRVQCNEAIADHPTVQVRMYAGDEFPTVGLLGFLNGLFGIREDGMGAICMEVDDDKKILRFKPTPSGVSDHSKEIKNFITNTCRVARDYLIELGRSEQLKSGKILEENQAWVLGRLHAIGLIDQYESIESEMSQGLETLRGFLGPIEVKPNGQKTAVIRLWSGRSGFPKTRKEMDT